MNPGDLCLYWRNDRTRGLAIQHAVESFTFWPQRITLSKDRQTIDIYGGTLEFAVRGEGELLFHDDKTGEILETSVVPVRDSLPEDGHFPVTVMFRPAVLFDVECGFGCKCEGRFVRNSEGRASVVFQPSAQLSMIQLPAPLPESGEPHNQGPTETTP